MIDENLGKVIERWVDYLEIQRKYSSHTINSYLSDLKFFLDFFRTSSNRP